MKIYQLRIFTYILSINLLNAFYLRKEADENFILLNDNSYRNNNIDLNLRYISSENFATQNSGRVEKFPSIKENNPILNINSIYTINKLKRKKKILNQNENILTSPIKRTELKSISTVPIVENISILERQYNLSLHNSISIKCILIQNINKKKCISPSIFDKTDITPSNKMNQIYHDYYW